MSAASPRRRDEGGIDARRRWVLAVVCLASALVILAIQMPSVVLPAIGSDLSAGFAELQWVVNAYALSLAALLLAAGSLSDRLGRKRVFVVGLVLFLVSSLLCGLAWNAPVLDLARAAQGAGGAALFAGSLAILGEEFRGPQRGSALGIWGAAVAASIAVAPLVGGALGDALGWRWIFFFCVVLTLPAIPLSVSHLSESRHQDARGGIDWVGTATLGSGVFFLVFGLVGGNDEGWGSPTILGAFALGALLLVAFVAVERAGRSPMLDLSLFRVPTFVGASLVAFMVSAAVFAMTVFTPQYFITATGTSPLGAGLRMLPFALAAFAASVLTARISGRLPLRTFIAVGMALVGLGLALMYGVEPDSSLWRLAPGMALAGAGLGFVNPLLAAAALGVVSPARGGMASGVNNTFRQLGVAVGVAGLGAILQREQGRRALDLLSGPGSFSRDRAGELARLVASGDAAGAAASVAPAARMAVTTASSEAFVDGFNAVLLVGAAVAFAGAILAFVLVRSRDFAAVRTGRPRVDTGVGQLKHSKEAGQDAPG